MARYKLQFTITNSTLAGQVLRVEDAIGTLFVFSFYSPPDPAPQPNPVVVGAVIGQTELNLDIAFRNAYNSSGRYIQYRTGSSFVVEGEFALVPELDAGSTPNITLLVSTLSEPLTITSSSFYAAVSNQCNLINFTLTTSRNIIKVNQPVVQTGLNTQNAYITGLSRDTRYLVEVEALDGAKITISIQTPPFLNFALITLSITGNSMSISNGTGLSLEYSLNNSTWSDIPTFSNLPEGANQTLYIRDSYGCNITKPFTIEEGATDPVVVALNNYFLYPKANAIRMANRESINDSTVHWNDNNSLSCELKDGVVWKEQQYYYPTDSVTIQVKSNYDDLAITLNPGGAVALTQKTNNLNLKESMDALTKQITAGQFGVYFTSGNIYDYDTGATTGTYILDGTLPDWAEQGNSITVGGVVYPIESISFDEELDSDIIIFNGIAPATNIIVKVIYNAFPYEVFEGTINMAGRTKFNVEIFYDGAIQKVSEEIYVTANLPRNVLVTYSMRYNTDMFWNTGLRQRLRLLVDKAQAQAEGSEETFKTDTDVIQVSSANYEVEKFTFLPVTKPIARLIQLAMLHSDVNINGIDYVSKDIPEMEALDDSNLYVITATLFAKGGWVEYGDDRVNTLTTPALLQDNYGMINY